MNVLIQVSSNSTIVIQPVYNGEVPPSPFCHPSYRGRRYKAEDAQFPIILTVDIKFSMFSAINPLKIQEKSNK